MPPKHLYLHRNLSSQTHWGPNSTPDFSPPTCHAVQFLPPLPDQASSLLPLLLPVACSPPEANQDSIHFSSLLGHHALRPVPWPPELFFCFLTCLLSLSQSVPQRAKWPYENLSHFLAHGVLLLTVLSRLLINLEHKVSDRALQGPACLVSASPQTSPCGSCPPSPCSCYTGLHDSMSECS